MAVLQRWHGPQRSLRVYPRHAGAHEDRGHGRLLPVHQVVQNLPTQHRHTAGEASVDVVVAGGLSGVLELPHASLPSSPLPPPPPPSSLLPSLLPRSTTSCATTQWLTIWTALTPTPTSRPSPSAAESRTFPSHCLIFTPVAISCYIGN